MWVYVMASFENAICKVLLEWIETAAADGDMQDTQIELLAAISVDCGPVAASAAAVHLNRYIHFLYCIFYIVCITVIRSLWIKRMHLFMVFIDFVTGKSIQTSLQDKKENPRKFMGLNFINFVLTFSFNGFFGCEVVTN